MVHPLKTGEFGHIQIDLRFNMFSACTSLAIGNKDSLFNLG